MNLLSELEGLSGENLCSSVLRLLLIRSQDLRDRFVNLLSRDCRSGPITLGSHFSSTLEQPTEDSGRWGRLDLLLEMSDAVVGIENKLYAAFQEGQPHKYLETVTQHAEALTNLRKRKHQPVVAVLAPKSRSSEIAKVIGNDERFLTLHWEDVLKNLMEATPNLDPMTNVLMQALNSFVCQQMALFPEFAKWIPHLRRSFERGGTPLQREVVAKIWQFFPDPGRRLSSGETWCGYYFTDSSLSTRGWYGFVPKREISEHARNTAELIIATSFDVQFQDPVFRRICLKAGPTFIGASEISVWAVDFDDSWADPDVWRKHLVPLSGAYGKFRDTRRNESG